MSKERRGRGQKDGRWASTPDALSLLLSDLDRHPLPSPVEQERLARRVAAGDAEAKKEMVAANVRLVLHWARRYTGSGIELADLVQEGIFGLTRAVEKFDPDRGFKFSTYATWWIRQSLQRAVQQHGRAIRLPEDALAEERAAEMLGEASGRVLPRVTASLDAPTTEEAGSLGDVVAGIADDVAPTVLERLAREELHAALGCLEPLDRAVLEHRFGLGGGPRLSIEATGRALGIGTRAVRQREQAALAALAEMPELARQSAGV